MVAARYHRPARAPIWNLARATTPQAGRTRCRAEARAVDGKDSEQRQRTAIEGFAKAAGY